MPAGNLAWSGYLATGLAFLGLARGVYMIRQGLKIIRWVRSSSRPAAETPSQAQRHQSNRMDWNYPRSREGRVQLSTIESGLRGATEERRFSGVTIGSFRARSLWRIVPVDPVRPADSSG